MAHDPATVDVDSPISEAARIMRAADTKIEQAVQLMRSKAIRRLPVVDGDQPVGMVSIGDLVIERDEASALADISAAESNQ